MRLIPSADMKPYPSMPGESQEECVARMKTAGTYYEHHGYTEAIFWAQLAALIKEVVRDNAANTN